jgi:selenocysteine-specific elongation factor
VVTTTTGSDAGVGVGVAGGAGGGSVATHRVVVTAGHVDHGKSTLVKALTGTDPDRLEEERRRGLTIELGFAWTDLPPVREGQPGQTVAIVDVPGHHRFLGTMLAGAGPAPAAMLIVAADDGWSAQTEEHVEVLDLLGVPGVLVAVTKTDLVEPDRVTTVVTDVASRLRGTCLDGAPIVPVAAAVGHGVERVATTLANRLAGFPRPRDHGRARLWVDRVFPISGAGTVVTGTLGGGAVRVGDQVRVLPTGLTARVRAVRSLGVEVEAALPGTRVALNLAGVDHDQVERGQAVVAGGPWLSSDVVDVVLRTVPGHVVDRRGAWRVHSGTAAVTARVLPVTDPVATDGAVRLLLDEPLPLVVGDGVVLREAGRAATVAGGHVADPSPTVQPHGRRAREARVRSLRALAAASEPTDRLLRLLEASGGGVPGGAALARAGLAGDRPPPEGVVAVADHAVLRSALERWAAAAKEAVAAGPHGRDQLTAALSDLGAPEPVAAALPDHLAAAGVLARGERGFLDPAALDAEGARRRTKEDALLGALRAEPFTPPDLTTAAREVGLDHRAVTTMVHRGDIVRSGDIAFAASVVGEAIDRLERVQAEVGPFTASQAREAWGTTRKYAIPLLEHLDKVGATRFDGRLRTLTGRRPS